MKRSSLVGHVVELYQACLTERQPADSLIQKFFRARRYLGAADRRFIAEAVYGMIRNFKLLDYYAGQLYRGPDLQDTSAASVRGVVHYMVYAMVIQGETPDSVIDDLHVWIHPSVWDKHMRPVVSVIRSAGLREEILQDPCRRLSVLYSMPEFIVEEWITTYGPMEAEELCQALNLPAPTAIRVNTVKTTVEKCQRALEREGVECGRTRLSPDGLILQKRIGASASSIFARGWFEMQDEGSQVISYLLKPFSGARVVDACAGSGGKSLHIAALMGNRGVVYAIDSSSARLSRMQERIQRAGVSIIHPLIPTKNAREIEMLSGSSDAVLIDAPCSGTGTFRRNPAAKLILTEGIVYDYSEKQRRILNEYSTMVKPGGLLIYATCSLLRSENEDQVGQFLRDHPEFKLIPAGARLEPFGITLATSDAFLRLWPHRHGTDGFFAAAMLREAVI